MNLALDCNILYVIFTKTNIILKGSVIDFFVLETVVTVIQIISFFTLGFWLVIKSKDTKNPIAVCFLAMRIMCFALGSLYYELFYLLKKAPPYVSAADVAWIGSFYFIIASCYLLGIKSHKTPFYAYFFAGAIVVVMLIISLLYGHFILNLLWAIPMAVLAKCAGEGVYISKNEEYKRLLPFFISIIMSLFYELMMFLSWGMVYVIFDALWTVGIISTVLTLYKGVGD